MAKKKVVDKAVDTVESFVEKDLMLGDIVTVTSNVRFTTMYDSAASMQIKTNEAEIIGFEKGVAHPVKCLIDGIECWMNKENLTKN